MRRFHTRLTLILITLLGVGLCSAGLAVVVQYKPYGVPDHQRERYEHNVREILHKNEQLKAASARPNPRAVTAETRHEFGLLLPHTTASHQFVIRNEGRSPLAIDVIDTTCKCTVGDVTDPVVLPGQSTTITMTWNTGNKADRYEQSARVRTNDPLRRSIDFHVSGTVRADLVVPETVHLGVVDPGQPSSGHFYVYSQTWQEMIVEEVGSDLRGFDWNVMPVDVSGHPTLVDSHAVCGWRVDVSAISPSPGTFGGEITVKVRGDSPELITRRIAATGRVHSTISFHSPQLHSSEGLDLGTLVSDKDHEFHVTVRQRAGHARSLSVIKTHPAILHAELTPMQKAGDYRLTLRIPADSPTAAFNLETHQGYVQVGDPDTPGLSNWFPVLGAVVSLDR